MMEVEVKFDEHVSKAGNLKERVASYFVRLERKIKFLPEESRKVWVKVSKLRGQYIVKGLMKILGRSVVVEKRGDQLIGVITEVRNDLVRKIRKLVKRD